MPGLARLLARPRRPAYSRTFQALFQSLNLIQKPDNVDRLHGAHKAGISFAIPAVARDGYDFYIPTVILKYDHLKIGTIGLTNHASQKFYSLLMCLSACMAPLPIIHRRRERNVTQFVKRCLGDWP